MRNICILLQWLSKGRMCFGACRDGLCHKKDTKLKKKIMNWDLEIAFHWPHDRFALGWEAIGKDKEHDYSTYKLYLFIATFTLNI